MRLTRGAHHERGDTIIEVIFAIVIFAFVAISSLAIMNQGVATGEQALEITLVRQQVNAQAEALRYIHEAAVVNPLSSQATTWNDITTIYGHAEASKYGVDGGECVLPPDSYKPFILNARTAKVWKGKLKVEYDGGKSLPPYSQVVYNDKDSSVVDAAYGMWVEAVPSSASVAKPFVDFHIRACWPAPGSSVPMTIGTIVRLYDPS